MEIVDEVVRNLGRGVAEPKLLIELINLAYKYRSLFPYVMPHPINFIAKMKSSLNPGKGSTTKLYITKGLCQGAF